MCVQYITQVYDSPYIVIGMYYCISLYNLFYSLIGTDMRYIILASMCREEFNLYIYLILMLWTLLLPLGFNFFTGFVYTVLLACYLYTRLYSCVFVCMCVYSCVFVCFRVY